MAWNTGVGTVARAEAIKLIVAKAKSDGISGTFKVYYDGNLIATEGDMPEQVDMNLVKVSTILPQA